MRSWEIKPIWLHILKWFASSLIEVRDTYGGKKKEALPSSDRDNESHSNCRVVIVLADVPHHSHVYSVSSDSTFP